MSTLTRTSTGTLEDVNTRIDRRDLTALAILCLAAVGIPLWLSTAAGAVGIPSNDDWVYMRAAGSLYRTGTLEVTGHTAAFIGQLLMVQPLLWLSGGASWAFEAFGLLMALVAVASTYLLARRFVATGSAVMVVLLVVAFPGFVRQSASFMTDGPTFAFIALCLLLGVRWLQGDGGRATLLASLVAGLVGVSIREFALAAPVAILVAAWARSRAEERTGLAWLTGLVVAGVACVLLAADSLPGHGAPVGMDLARLGLLAPTFVTFAAALLPAIALGLGRGLMRISPAHLLLGAALVLLVSVIPYGPFVGNYWMAEGFVGDIPLLSGARDPVIGALAWALSQQLALFAAILLAALGFRWGDANLAGVDTLRLAGQRALLITRSREAPLLLFLAAYAAEMAVFVAVGPLFDRYLYPILPVAAILLLQGSPRPALYGRSPALAHGALVWLAASAFVIAANSFAYDAARWRAGDAAVAVGYDPVTVDAGLEWVQDHSSTLQDPRPKSYGVTTYDDWYMSPRPCAVVSSGTLELSDYVLIRVDRSAYRQYLFFGPNEPLYLYGAVAVGCPAPPAAETGGTARAASARVGALPGGYTSAIVRSVSARNGGGL